jgi:hypothetical protein
MKKTLALSKMISTHIAGRVAAFDAAFLLQAIAAVVNLVGAASSRRGRRRRGSRATVGFVDAVVLLRRSVQEKRKGAINTTGETRKHLAISRM